MFITYDWDKTLLVDSEGKVSEQRRHEVQSNRKLTKVKVRFTLRAGMVKVGNQRLDDRYIRLRSHRIDFTTTYV